jgi:hypothetical protein
MIRFCLPALRLSELEIAFAAMWVCLERHAVATPRFHLQFLTSDRVVCTIHAASPRTDAALFEWWKEQRFGEMGGLLLRRWKPISCPRRPATRNYIRGFRDPPSVYYFFGTSS